MAIRFFAEFSTSKGNTWRINIHDQLHVGAAAEGNVSSPGMELEWHGGEDIYSPLMPSTCRVPWIVASQDEEDWIVELSDFEEGRFSVEVRYDPDGANSRHWLGVIVPESLKIPDEARPFVIQVEAVCGLSLLSRKDYDVNNQVAGAKYNTSIDHTLNALRAIPYRISDFFAIQQTMLTIIEDVVPDLGGVGDNFGEDVFFTVETYDPGVGLQQVGTYEDVLVQVLTMMNARLMMYGGRFMIQPIPRMMQVGGLITNARNYDRLTNLVSTSGIVGFGVSFDQLNRHRLGGYFYFMPAVRKISRTINFFGNAPFAGSRELYPYGLVNIGNTINTAYPTTYSISGLADATLDGTQIFRIKGFLAIRQPFYDGVKLVNGNSVSNYPEMLCRWRVELEVRVGTRYLQRAYNPAFTYTTVPGSDLYDSPVIGGSPGDQRIFDLSEPGAFTWTTNSAARVYLWSDIVLNGLNEYYQEEIFTRLDWDFQTPTLGSTEDADVEVNMRFRAYHGEATALNPDAYVSGDSVQNTATQALGDVAIYCGDGTSNGDTITFGAEIDNGATEEIEIVEGLYSEGTSNDALNFNPAALRDIDGELIPGFTSTVTTATTPLAELLCLDRLHWMGEPQEGYQGTFQSYLVFTAFEVLTFDGKKWLASQLKYSAEEDLYEIDCVKIKTLGTLDPGPADVKRSNLLPGMTPAGSSGQLQESVNRGRRDLSSVQASIDDGLSDLGAKFTNGLNELGDVNLSALTNLDVLQYSQASGVWRNQQINLLLGALTDVALSTPQAGEVLSYNGTSWENATAGSGGATELKDLTDVNSLLTPSVGELLVYTNVNGGQWSSNSVSLIVGGALSAGDLNNVTETGTGTAGHILLDYALGGSAYWISTALSTAATSWIELKNLKDVSTATPTTGQVLAWSGSNWAPADAASGGGMAEVPLIQVSGRYTWANTDSGERIYTGSTAYGPTNWYNHAIEPPDTVMRNYSASHTVDSTTALVAAFDHMGYAHYLPSDSKKIRVKIFSRFQNGANQTFGFSVWHVATFPNQGTKQTATATLIAKSADLSVDLDSGKLWRDEFTSTTAYAGGAIFLLAEHRSGTLSTSTYAYCNASIFLID